MEENRKLFELNVTAQKEKIKLRDWQKEAYEEWIENNCKGIIQSATGTGKTFIGLKLIEDTELYKKILIIVPTIQLLNQWYNFISKELNLESGRIGGGYNEYKRITIAVINSVRLLKLNFDVLILDEIHHIFSNESIKLLFNNKFDEILGLSATVERSDDRHLLLNDLKVVYNYTQKEAINNKDLCRYNLINVGVDLLEGERVIYNNNDRTIKELFPIFNYDLSEVFSNGKYSIEKIRLRRAITKRKEILYNAKNKVIKTIELINKNIDKKIIVFCEYIKTIKELERLLNSEIKYGVYHSGICSKEREEVLKDYREDNLNILLSAKALDEGINVPQCNVAIIIAGSKTARQIIQRLGRILRPKEQIAQIYQLYVKETADVKWLIKKINYIKGFDNIFWE